MEARRIYHGQVLDILYLVDGRRAPAREFVYSELTRDQQNQMIQLVQRMANERIHHHVGRFRQLHGYQNHYEFKKGEATLLCFYDGPGRLVLTHGFKKKSERTPRPELERAVRLRDLYLSQ